MTSEAVKTVKNISLVVTLLIAVGGTAYALGGAPDSEDFKELNARVKEVEIFRAAVEADIRAIRASLTRMEGVK